MMYKNNFNCQCYDPCFPATPKQNCIINVINPVSQPQPFLSSYLEASGSGQTLSSGTNVAFDIGVDEIDIVGTAITVDNTGTVFTINQSGLYHIEWNVNLESGTDPIILCILENGSPASAVSSSVSSGNISSGALIYVKESEIPFTISLLNFGGAITIADPENFEDTAASIRILRFADGPTV